MLEKKEEEKLLPLFCLVSTRSVLLDSVSTRASARCHGGAGERDRGRAHVPVTRARCERRSADDDEEKNDLEALSLSLSIVTVSPSQKSAITVPSSCLAAGVPMAFHPTFTPVPRTSDEKHRSKSPPPRAPKPAGTAPLSSASASAARPVPVHLARATNPPGTDGEPLAVSLEKESGAGAGGEEKGLGGEPFATYADDVRELVAALQRALKEEEEEEGKEEESREKKNNKLTEAASVARAFLHQQLRLAGDAERRSLAELKGAVKGLLLFEDRREELRRRRQREAGAAEEAEEEKEEEKEKQTERLPEELRREVRRGLKSTLAVLLVEEESAREKGLLH